MEDEREEQKHVVRSLSLSSFFCFLSPALALSSDSRVKRFARRVLYVS